VLQEVDLELSRDVFEPDLVVLEESAYGTNPLQAKDVRLAVEVTSPPSGTMDRIVKPAALAEAGVPHYWRVDIEGAPHVEVYELDGRTYRLARTLHAGAVTRLEQPFPVEIDPAILVRAAH
jgi:Uma2 family endonuclease